MKLISRIQAWGAPVSKVRYHQVTGRLMVLSGESDACQIWQTTRHGVLEKISEFGGGADGEHRALDACWHPGGNSLAMVGLHRRVEIRSVPGGAVLNEIGDPGQPEFGWPGYTAVAFSAAGDRLAASSIGNSRTEIYALPSGEGLGEYEVVGMQAALAIQPFGDIVANAMRDQAASLLHFSRIRPAVEVFNIQLDVDFDVAGAVFSPDGNVLAVVGGHPSLQVYEFPSLRRRFFFEDAEQVPDVYLAPDLPVFERVAFSPDSTRLVCPSAPGELVELDAVTGHELTRWQAHMGPCTSVELGVKDELLFSSGMDGAINVWQSAYPAVAVDEARAQRSASEFLARVKRVDPFAHWSEFEVVE